MTTRNGKRSRESLEEAPNDVAWPAHVDKKLRSNTLNAEDDRRHPRGAVSRVRSGSFAIANGISGSHLRLTSDVLQSLGAHPVYHPVERPGVPAPTDTSAFIVPNRPSPALRADDRVSTSL